MEAVDLNLVTYVVRIQPHETLRALSADGTYYLAAEKEEDNNILILHGKPVCITYELVSAKIFQNASEAIEEGRAIEGLQTVRTTVHPVSKKVFFAASLKGER